MKSELQIRSKDAAYAGYVPLHARVLQRKCACGGSSGGSGECEECRKKKDSLLQRKAGGEAQPFGVPPIVHEVLGSPGQPMDHATRAFFEPRFGHDFSQVRIHADTRAAESTQAVNALAYTVGRDIVFGDDQFAPRSFSGHKLLAHELAHVVQQRGQESLMPQSISEAHDPSEREADRMAEAVTRGGQRAQTTWQTTPRLIRKVRVDKPGDMIPNPGGQGLKITNATAIENYLLKIADGSGASVNRTSGKVSLSTAYCPGFLGGMVAGAKFGFGLFKGIPLLGPILGGVAAIVGGLIGGIAGLFGSEKPSAAASSFTPTGSTCLCDMVDAGTMWTIAINEQDTPATLNNKSVRVPSPNSQKAWGSTTMSGRQEENEPWLILAHELCGHAWLEQKGQDENRDIPPSGIHDPATGKPFVASNQPLSKEMPFRHERSVERENLIRQEHGMEARGYRLKDPYCGESFWRDRALPKGPEHFQEEGKGTGWPTYLDECAYLRSQLPENKNGKYGIGDKIP